MKLFVRAAPLGVVVGGVLLAAPATAAGPSALSPSPRHLKLTASGCCAFGPVVFTNTSSSTVYLTATPVPTGDGWNTDYGNTTCFVCSRLSPRAALARRP